VFEHHRPRLFRMAYGLLGSVAEAEDVVQDAYLRWHGVDEASNPGAYLSTIVTRLCLDVLKSSRSKREEYVGQWLPEMLVEAPSPETTPAFAGELSYGFMTMLERLTPEQRAVYVLRTAFDLEYESIAETLGTSAASCRQMMKKARARMKGPARFKADRAESHELAARFADACNAGEAKDINAMLAESCRFMSDGGGVVSAARRPVLGARRVCRMLVGLRRKHGLRFHALPQSTGASPLLRVESSGVVGMAALDLDERGAVVGVFLQWNPDKFSQC